jgi:hypothetical protein
MALDCLTDVQPVGASACKQFPQAIESIIKTPLDFTILAADASDVTEWQDAVLADPATRIYPFPLAYDFENLSEEATRASSNLGKEVTVRLGQYRFRLLFRENLEIHKAIYSHLGSAGRVFLIDINKKLIGTSDDDGVTLKGLLLDQFMPEKIQFGDGSTPSLSPVYMSLTNNEEIDVNGVQIRFNTQFIALKPIVAAKLTLIGTPTATGFTLSVKSTYDNVGVKGLTLPDFVETLGGGTLTINDNGDGTYTFSGAGITTGTITLAAAADLTVKAYEASNVLTVTIV